MTPAELQPEHKSMKTAQKTITIDGTRYTAAKLLELAKQRGEPFVGGDICIKVPGGQIAIREYPNEEEIAVLNYGLVRRDGQPFGGAVAFLK